MNITTRLIVICLMLIFASPVVAATYYIDFDEGDDSNSGVSAQAAFKHCPGDRQAGGDAKATTLQAGDVVKFKGGITYRGLINISQSGEKGKPIVFDGNLDNSYGEGKAIIDGSKPVVGLAVCSSADEVSGNPNYEYIYVGYLPKGSYWNTVGLSQGDDILPVSQEPNSPDAIFQENPAYYVKTNRQPPVTATDFKVRYLSQMDENVSRPLIAMFDGSRNSAVVGGINGGGEIEIELDDAVTVKAISITPQPNYGNPRRVTFHGDGKLILDAEFSVSGKKAAEQKFELPAPAEFRKLVVKFHSAHPQKDGRVLSWGAIQQIAAYDEAGENVLHTKRTTTLTNEYFEQADSDYWDGAYLAIYARPAMVYYKKVLDYDPASKTVTIETLSHSQVPYNPGSAFSMLNSPRIIDKTGEYSVNVDAEADGRHKFYVWPLRVNEGVVEGLTYAAYESAFVVNRASYVTIEGFMIKKQGGARGSNGINARGPASNIIVKHTTVTGLRGRSAAIHSSRVDNVLIDNCQVIDNAGHTKGILLRDGENIISSNCLLQRNSSTALDYYNVHNGVVRNCTVIDNTGMHANGLTFYLGCSDILVENNYVARGNVALTLQHGKNMIIRNNIMSGNRSIGLWGGRPYDNIIITNNVLMLEGEEDSDYGAIYGGNNASSGYTIANNIIDGLSGNVMRKAEIHHNIFTSIGPVQTEDNIGENMYVSNKDEIYLDYASGDYRLREGSVAINGGVMLGGINRFDRDGNDRSLDRSPDIGPSEYVGVWGDIGDGDGGDPFDFEFTFSGYEIQPAGEIDYDGYMSVFKQRDGGGSISVRGIDFVKEIGGSLDIHKAEGWVSQWDKQGHSVEWVFDVEKAGVYELVLRFASEVPSIRRVDLNGEGVAGLEEVRFKATGGWRLWEMVGLGNSLQLEQGESRVRLTNVNNSLNIQEIILVPLFDGEVVESHWVEGRAVGNGQ